MKSLLFFSLSLLMSVLVISSCTKKDNSPAATAKVTYNANGGKFASHGSVSTIDTLLKIGEYVPFPEKPVRPNYVFKGWCEDKECKTSWQWLTKVEKEVTLYAKWEDDGGGGGGGGGKKTLKVEADTVSVTKTTAIIRGKVTIAAGTVIDDYGVKYCVEPFVDTVMISVKEISYPAMFSCSVENLIPDTTYKYCAYAVDAKGNEVKSTEKSFRTKPGLVYPEAPWLPCIEINGIIWAPVNCGYDSTDYKYGKLYQWGRKNGCGYNDNKKYIESIIQQTSDSETPIAAGNEDESIFYRIADEPKDWLTPQDSTRWNKNLEWPGKETSPTKAEYDPCPSGWRVPTAGELTSLLGSHTSGGLQDGTGVHSGMKGKWFDGSTASEPTSGVFMPVAGVRGCGEGNTTDRGSMGCYWSSSVSDTRARILFFIESGAAISSEGGLANGFSVRCVQE